MEGDGSQCWSLIPLWRYSPVRFHWTGGSRQCSRWVQISALYKSWRWCSTYTSFQTSVDSLLLAYWSRFQFTERALLRPPGEIQTSGEFLASVQPDVYMLGWWEDNRVVAKKQTMISKKSFEREGLGKSSRSSRGKDPECKNEKFSSLPELIMTTCIL